MLDVGPRANLEGYFGSFSLFSHHDFNRRLSEHIEGGTGESALFGSRTVRHLPVAESALDPGGTGSRLRRTGPEDHH